MVMATGIKNTILVFLLILIFHFLIKNALLDKRMKQVPSTIEKYENTLPTTIPIRPSYTMNAEQMQERGVVGSSSGSVGSVEDNKIDPKTNNTVCESGPQAEVDDDLYTFVYGDDAKADASQTQNLSDSDIAKYFTGLDVTRDIEKNIEENMKCVALTRKDDLTMPVSTTCDAALKSDGMLAADSKQVKANCNISQQLPI